MGRFLANNKSNTTAGCGCAGFTIIEVMVALAILSIALTGIYRLHGQTMTVSGAARFYSLAPRLAQAKLSEIERQAYNTLSNAAGEYGESYPGYKWSIQIEEVTTALFTENYYHLTQIDIDITQDEKSQYSLRTYRFFVD